MRIAIEDKLIRSGVTIFDYGCGHGEDVRHLCRMGYECRGWDPTFRPDEERVPADVVNVGYVVNVVEDPFERSGVLHDAWGLTLYCMVVAARLTTEARSVKGSTFGDGVITRHGTFQKFFEQRELREWIDATLDVASVPTAPGVFYVFRDDDARQAFVAARYRRCSDAPRLRRSDVLFEEHRALLEPLMEFVAWRGRLPSSDELDEGAELVQAIGSIKRAFRVILTVTGTEEWDRIKEERSQDLLVHLALARFDGRPKFSHLATELQRDVRALFSSYKRACHLADALLFSAGELPLVNRAIREASVGKITGNALYVHRTALEHLSPILRVYEGCARSYLGNVDGANLIKLRRDKPKVSYLCYPTFDREAHPAITESMVVSLHSLNVRYLDFRDYDNQFILHRKEDFVADDYPGRDKFARLTRQEERRGLFDDVSRIGTRNGWLATLDEKGLRLSGHRVVRVNSLPPPPSDAKPGQSEDPSDQSDVSQG